MIQMRNITREWVASDSGADKDVTGRRTQKTVLANCPFCGTEVKLYLWSLAGSGKKCTCGAMFYIGGCCSLVMEIAGL